MIFNPGDRLKTAVSPIITAVFGMHNISVVDLSTVMLDQAVSGFEKDPLQDVDLVRLAKTLKEKK